MIKPHPALNSVMHLFPENLLVSGDENIPGLAASPTGITDVSMSKNKANTFPCNKVCLFKVLEGLCIGLSLNFL